MFDPRTRKNNPPVAQGAAPEDRGLQHIGVVWTFNDLTQVLFARHPYPVYLATQAQMQAYSDDGIRFWRQHCNGQKVYIVVDLANVTTNLDEIDFCAKQTKRVLDECAVIVVRYNGGLVQRIASRMTAIQLHTPSNIYGSFGEALQVVQEHQRGTVQSAIR